MSHRILIICNLLITQTPFFLLVNLGQLVSLIQHKKQRQSLHNRKPIRAQLMTAPSRVVFQWGKVSLKNLLLICDPTTLNYISSKKIWSIWRRTGLGRIQMIISESQVMLLIAQQRSPRQGRTCRFKEVLTQSMRWVIARDSRLTVWQVAPLTNSCMRTANRNNCLCKTNKMIVAILPAIFNWA